MANKKPSETLPAKTLRERAEEMLATSRTDISGMSNDDIQKLVHELQVHQMELEIQNEDLRETQIALAHSRDRYSDLYEFAPVGYLLLDRQGKILEANLTAATMLGVERNRLVHRKITNFLPDDAQKIWHLYRRELFVDDSKRACELLMNHADGQSLTIRLESRALPDEDSNLTQCRTAMIDVTTVRQAQQQLEFSEQRYRRLTDAVIDYIFHVRVENGCEVETLHGPNCEAIAGYTPDELAANTLLWISIVPVEDQPLVEHHIRELLAGERPAPLEHRIRRKDGVICWVLRVTSPHLDDQGRLISYDGLLRDITERKEAEVALRELNINLDQSLTDRSAELDKSITQIKLLSEAIAHLGEGVVITSNHLDWPGPHILFVNHAMCQITGYTAEELIGQSPRILQGDGTDRKTLDKVKSELSAGRSVLAELTSYRKDGTPYDAELFITPLIDSEGRRTNFVSIHRNITERRQAEAALREREERLRAVLETATDSIINIDRCGIITDVNPATEQMFGYTQEELIGQNVKILMPQPYRDEHDDHIARYLETGNAQIIGIGREAAGERKDGSMFPIDLVVSEVDHLGFFTGVIRDSSERKKLQRDVIGIAEDEQRRIGQDLHDGIQQELAGLGMLAQTLLNNFAKNRGDLSKTEQHRILTQKIVEGISRTHREVQSISRGLVPINLQPEGLMDALRELAFRTDELDGVSCAFKCEQDVLVGDSSVATHLYRIAQEALTNALKHAQPEHVLVALESDNGDLVLQVADDGVGFDSATESEGMGLKTMRYRASLIGANLTVRTVDAGGTLVTCKVYRGNFR